MADDARTDEHPTTARSSCRSCGRPPALASWNGSGFLAWDPRRRTSTMPPGEQNLGASLTTSRAQLGASGEIGCGLRIVARGLVPLPRRSGAARARMSVVDNNGSASARKDSSTRRYSTQRAAFLRDDSLLAIVMLTDENDCSIIDDDGQQGFLVTSTRCPLPRASSQCAADPNDRCCHSCAARRSARAARRTSKTPSARRRAAAEATHRSPSNEDKSDLRCFDHKRRFGTRSPLPDAALR